MDGTKRAAWKDDEHDEMMKWKPALFRAVSLMVGPFWRVWADIPTSTEGTIVSYCIGARGKSFLDRQQLAGTGYRVPRPYSSSSGHVLSTSQSRGRSSPDAVPLLVSQWHLILDLPHRGWAAWGIMGVGMV